MHLHAHTQLFNWHFTAFINALESMRVLGSISSQATCFSVSIHEVDRHF